VNLLPTPRANAATGANNHGDGGTDIQTAVAKLLPTPTAVAAEHNDQTKDRGRGTRDDHNLWTVAIRPEFGPYAGAVARWETASGRDAPPPTEPGRNGPRLNPRFVEWMMGLEPGWVTDPAIGLSRAAQLKALGNGVVPQQAELALRVLLGNGSA